MELRVGEKYRLGRKIGSGSFGDIYLATNVETKQEVAVKLESVRKRLPQVPYEAKVYKILLERGMQGIPKLHWYGIEGDYNVMIIDLMGPSLADLFQYCGRRFSLKTVLLLADQLLTRLEDLHSHHFIHRSIKPHNLMLGLKPTDQDNNNNNNTSKCTNVIYLLDFGTANRYRDPQTLEHVAYREKVHLTQRPEFSSLNAHMGTQQSRRDDLESLGYTLLYFLRGSLPWGRIVTGSRKKQRKETLERMLSISPADLCKDCPPEFATYLKYCRALRYGDQPDYSYLKKLFRELFERRQLQDDGRFDWDVKNDEVATSKTNNVCTATLSREVSQESSSPPVGKTDEKEKVEKHNDEQDTKTTGTEEEGKNGTTNSNEQSPALA